MEPQPGEKQGNSNHAEEPVDSNQESNPMAPQPNEKQRNSNHAEELADISEEEVHGHNLPSTSQLIERFLDSASETAKRSSPGAPEIAEEEVNGHYRPLLQAAFRSDWEYAKRFFVQDPASMMAKITNRSETVLHVAALSSQDQFFENLVELLSPYPEVLEMVDRTGRTALHNAVLSGRIRMVKKLVRNNPKLTQLQDKKARVPLDLSAEEASMHKEIIWFLAKSTTNDEPSKPFSNLSAVQIMINLTTAGHHDITLFLIEQYPHLATMKSDGLSILSMLAAKRGNFPSGTNLSGLEALIYKCIPVDLNYKPTDENSRDMRMSMDPALQYLTRSIWNATKVLVPTIKRIHEVKSMHVTAVKLARSLCNNLSSMKTKEITHFFQEGEVVGQAIAKGISELVKVYIQAFPELMWISSCGVTFMTTAVRFRRERTFSLFLKVSSTNKLLSVMGHTGPESVDMMLAAAKYNPNFDAVTNVAGAAFQMQRELQWFKAVESCAIPGMKHYNVNKKTFWTIFVEQHGKLLENGERWAKDTANSCMLVSTLIATVLFAAAFTMPGGNDSNTGVPLLMGQNTFLVFAVSDALGLFSSVTAILLFLAILTSRYEPQDFLESLPKKIIMGLSLLFLSLAFMLVAFAATLTIVLDKRLEWVFIPVTLLASMPMVVFAGLQLPLLIQMVKSTYGPSIFRPESIWD